MKRMVRPYLPLFWFSLLSIACLLTPGSASADVRLPGFYTDHMVLQQQMPIRLRGWADAGEAVTVTLADHSAKAVTGEDGTWQVELPAMQAGYQAYVLRVQGANSIELNDILIGEVWLCSGQSNMEWVVRSSTNADAEIAAADYPAIRHVKIAHRPSTVPRDDVEAVWQICSPETVGNFTACGYFMARRLHAELNVPIGLVNSSWGGTRVEPWTPPVGFEKVEALQDIFQSVIGRTPGTPAYQRRLKEHIAATEDWLATAKTALTDTDGLPASPAYPEELKPFTSHQDPTMLYNGMIHALVGFPIRGAIWYQGESNHSEGMLYFEKKKALINGWRELWDQGRFPFYYVQIAPFQYGNEDPTILARFWEAQAAVQQLPNTGMVVINDIATLNNIHPPNKQDVGLRLANLALKHDYGQEEIVAHSPEFASLDVQDGHLKVTFRHAGGGLKTSDGAAPSHFEIIGPGSGGFRPAVAEINGDTVLLSSADVKSPVAFRFAWHKLAEPNLTGGTGLPVGACRGGELPDFLNMLPISREYQLVYDLDLSKLGREIRYDADHSADVQSFDRIAYLLELTSADGNEQKVFVSMKAFTDDVSRIGIPTASRPTVFQQKVESMDVYSTVADIAVGTGLATGNIEFWPHNYGPGNEAAINGASSRVYDFGDDPGPPTDGYGCLQIHNFGARQTILAINHWNAGANADIGIGNSPGQNRDWTFAGNAAGYAHKRLRVFVRGE
ncbi:MAG: sialate O-acetylesterase [Fuerstiella sp.]